jgi:xylose isomerase
MRTYLILKERAARWNADSEIQRLMQEMGGGNSNGTGKYSPAGRDMLLAKEFDRKALAARGLAYERLDQLTTEIILGAR